MPMKAVAHDVAGDRGIAQSICPGPAMMPTKGGVLDDIAGHGRIRLDIKARRRCRPRSRYRASCCAGCARYCASTGVRGYPASGIQILGNSVTNAGEVALYSEFGFEAAIIANNIVDGASTGVSVANFN